MKNAPPAAPGGSRSFPVVGIGASAGGLDAFRRLLEHLPLDTSMAFVLVQHLDPTHKSALADLLGRSTALPVIEISEGMRVEPDHVYVIPPNTRLAISEGILGLRPREEGRAGRHPVDAFLRTLADDRSHRAIGVVLSGTDSDGTLGLEAIKAQGGLTFAQDPASAAYDGMPRNAVAGGHVDFVLTPEGIGEELGRVSRHPFLSPSISAAPVENEPGFPDDQDGFRRILRLLHRAKGVDFTDYKASTLRRRIARRTLLSKLESQDDYASFLRTQPAELEALYEDILINVTRFFRNPDAFAILSETIFPRVVAERASDEPVRIWTLGCSTGEEAYSIAMSFVEFAAERAAHIPVQVFATDLSAKGIEQARAGLFPKDIDTDVSPERLRRFFTEADGGYRISKPIRDMVVFARQNVLTDPPFSRLDLISCRNLLIYLDPVLQKQVLPILHYALKPTGVLWLGSSETVGAASELFAAEDKKHRFYTRKPVSSRQRLQSARETAARDRAASGPARHDVDDLLRTEHDAQREADRILLARYAPAGVLINAELEILQFRGSTGAYLEAPAGKATLNVLKMAREGLMLPLRAAIQKAQKDGKAVRHEGLQVEAHGESRPVNLEVVPIKGSGANEGCLLVLFEPAPQEGPKRATPPHDRPAGRTAPAVDARRVTRLEEELAATRDYLQSLVEQQEAANEELQSSSEEIQSSNEELQSVNEELETSKEELESTNEELTTLNDELHNRNLELTVLTDDQSNVFTSTDMPILMLSRDQRIRRFTPKAENVLGLIATDVGRPVGDIRLRIDVPDLDAVIAGVVDTIRVEEREIQDKDGRWYLMRIRPYKTLDNRIDGAVVVLVDIDALKQGEAVVAASRDYAEAIIQTVREPLIVLDDHLRVRSANRSFYEEFQVSPAETEHRLFYDLGNRQWDIPGLRLLLTEILPKNSELRDFEVAHEFERLGRRTMLINARRLDETGEETGLILLAIEDITERKRADEALRESEERYRALFNSIDEGFCIIEKIEGEVGAPLDFRYLKANPAFEVQSGVGDVVGRTIRQAFPGEPEEWFNTYDAVVRTGEPVRFERGLVSQGRVLELFAFRADDVAHRRVAVIFRDVTERRRAEADRAEGHAVLEAHAAELARFNHAAVGRELRMIALKREMNDLCRRVGEPVRYPLEFEQEAEDVDG